MNQFVVKFSSWENVAADCDGAPIGGTVRLITEWSVQRNSRATGHTVFMGEKWGDWLWKLLPRSGELGLPK